MYLGYWRIIALKPAPLLEVGRKCVSELSNSGQTIPSLREYLLVDPEKRCVEVYRFGDTVQHETHVEGSFRLDCLDAEIALDDIYVDAETL